MAYDLSNLSLSQLEQAVELRRRIDSLQKQLAEVLGPAGNLRMGNTRGRPRSGASVRRGRRAVGAKPARWRKRKFSAAARAALSAAAKARWAKAKKAGKTRL